MIAATWSARGLRAEQPRVVEALGVRAGTYLFRFEHESGAPRPSHKARSRVTHRFNVLDRSQFRGGWLSQLVCRQPPPK